MGEAGIFSEDDRVELIDGEVVEMAAIGDRHVESVMRLTRLLSRWALLEATGDGEEGAAFFVGVQNPVVLSEHGEPQPDLVLVRRDARVCLFPRRCCLSWRLPISPWYTTATRSSPVRRGRHP